jgi:hypothetical protein
MDSQRGSGSLGQHLLALVWGVYIDRDLDRCGRVQPEVVWLQADLGNSRCVRSRDEKQAICSTLLRCMTDDEANATTAAA